VTASDDDRINYLAGEAVDALSPEERAELDRVRDSLGSWATWVEPDPKLEALVVETIVQEAAGAPTPAAAPAPRRRALHPRFARRRPALAFGAFAAAVAAVVAVIVIAAGNSGPAPEQFAMVVTGTALAPGAHGTATLTKEASGWKVDLSATGLPRLENGRYYQAWLKNAAGILVPIGTFNDARNVTLWSGVPVTQFRTLTVTVQLANGNPASSGRRAMIGTIRPKA
jgi:Anti-sigma-K factor rskA, C-terminal